MERVGWKCHLWRCDPPVQLAPYAVALQREVGACAPEWTRVWRPRLRLSRVYRSSNARAAQPRLVRRQPRGEAQKREQMGSRTDRREVHDQRQGRSLRQSLTSWLYDHEEFLPRILSCRAHGQRWRKTSVFIPADTSAVIVMRSSRFVRLHSR